MKNVQGLRKRTGKLPHHGDSKTLHLESVRKGDEVLVFHDDGSDISVRIDICQEEGVLIGTVLKVGGKPPGISRDDEIAFHEDFVFVITKRP